MLCGVVGASFTILSVFCDLQKCVKNCMVYLEMNLQT